MKDLKTDPESIRVALRGIEEGVSALLLLAEGNWKKQASLFSDAFFRGHDPLRVIATLFQENLNVSASRFCREASTGRVPALPKKRADRLALVFKIAVLAPKRAGAASIEDNIDLPFTVEHGFPAPSKAAQFERFRAEVIAPFAADMRAFSAAIEAKLKGARGQVSVREIAEKALKEDG